MKVAAVIAAAGKGMRTGFSDNKVLFGIGAMTLLEKSLSPFLSHNDVSHIVITANSADFGAVEAIVNKLQTDKKITVSAGGDTRSLSVKNALSHIAEDFNGLVAVHDAARPFIDTDFLTFCFAEAEKYGAVVPALPVTDTVKEAENGIIADTPDRGRFYTVQTPQVFDFQNLKKAYALAGGTAATDDASLYERHIGRVYIIDGLEQNIKLTKKSDFAAFFPMRFIVGTGFDTHRLTEGRKLILGGVEIPHTKGLLGHSDADVLAHAVTDAMLSALKLGDIGVLFPDTDPKYKDADSIKLLSEVLALVKKQGFAVNNVSAVLMAERPKLASHIPAITKKLAEALSIPDETVSVSATTNEGLGIVGREEGISCHAVCSMIKL